MKNRQDAWELVNEFTQSQNLVNHMRAVEAAMRAYARKFDEDEDYWGLVGLIHDFDYESHPDMGGDIPQEEWHTFAGARILQERGWPEPLVQDVLSHADYTGVPRDTTLRKALWAVDELTGLLVAVALVRPTKDIRDVTKIKSVKKKWKDKSFAAAVDREDIEQACQALGVDLWTEHVPLVLGAMQEIAGELGLDGRLSG